jgi:hypothetical protein
VPARRISFCGFLAFLPLPGIAFLHNLLKSPAAALGFSDNNSYLWMQKMSFANIKQNRIQ